MGHHVLSVIFGYLSAAAIFTLAHYLKKTNYHLAFMFKLNAQVLLFYITLRLHFFSVSPLNCGQNGYSDITVIDYYISKLFINPQ